MLVAIPALAVVLGVNNNGVELPVSKIRLNYTIPLLNGPFLHQSNNIFAGIFLPLAALAVIYQIMWIILCYINLDCMNKNNRIFSTIVRNDVVYL